MKPSQKWIAAALVFVTIGALTFIADRIPGQIDATATDRYTLSAASRDLVENLAEPTHIAFYFSRSVEGLPIQLKNFARQIEDLLAQYERAANANLSVAIIDPRPDTDAEQAAIRAGLTSQPLANGSSLFFGMAITVADTTVTIPFFTNDREPFLEVDISQLIFRAGQLTQPVVGLLSTVDLAEASPNPNNPMAPPSPAAFQSELEKYYEVRSLDAANMDTEGIDVLLVIHPQNLDSATLYAIDQFVLSGKPLLLALDPSSNVQRTAQMQQGGFMGMGDPTALASDLAVLLNAWGVSFDASQVVGDPTLAASVSAQRGAPPVPYPVWLAFNELQSDAPLLSSLNSLLWIEPGHLARSDNAPADLQWQPLLQTSASGATIAASALAFPNPEQIARMFGATGAPQTLAARLSGTFPSAFPDGPPAADTNAETDTATADDTGTANDTHLVQSSTPGTVVIFADSDFLADRYSVQVMNLFGMRAVSPLNDNLALFLNAVDALAGNPALMNLRGKGSATRPFSRLRDLEAAARTRYQSEVEALESELQSVQARLRELQQGAANQNQLVASPDVQNTIAEFRLKEAEVRSALREIRKDLREEVERLDLQLALVNLLLVPFVIAVAGVLFFLRRGR